MSARRDLLERAMREAATAGPPCCDGHHVLTPEDAARVADETILSPPDEPWLAVLTTPRPDPEDLRGLAEALRAMGARLLIAMQPGSRLEALTDAELAAAGLARLAETPVSEIRGNGANPD